MSDLYASIQKSMFAYFCKHNSHIIEENFAVPRKVKITKKAQRAQPRRYHFAELAHQGVVSGRLLRMDAERMGDAPVLVVDTAVVSNSMC